MIIGITTWGAFPPSQQKTVCSKTAWLWAWWPAASRITARGGTMLTLWFWFGPAMPPPVLTVFSCSCSQQGFLPFCRSQVDMTVYWDLTFFIITKELPNELKNWNLQVSRIIRGPTLSGNLMVWQQVQHILRPRYLVCTLRPSVVAYTQFKKYTLPIDMTVFKNPFF